MSGITVKLLSNSNSRHLQQVYTGFFMLHKSGAIELSQAIIKDDLHDPSKPRHLRDARFAHLRVILNNSLHLLYDTCDSWELDAEGLKWADFYFKRSLSRVDKEIYPAQTEKIYPLGLNYLVFPASVDRFALRRSIAFTGKKRDAFLAFIGSLNLPGFRKMLPQVNLMQAEPSPDAPQRILFMARAWDPFDHPARTEDKVQERIRLAEMRANCIRLLREKFGDMFYGGLIHSNFARKNYPDLLLPDNRRSMKWNYLNWLRSFPIGVATSGLNGSTGWKFAEYIAFSKAILSERLNYLAPGDLQEGVHYLGFSSPEECVENAQRLVSDRELCFNLMSNNFKYYQDYLKPDTLVMNTLQIALSKQAGLND